MRFTAIYEIHPPGIFGLPEEGYTIVASRDGNHSIPSDPFTSTPPFHKVGWGALSEYRADKDAINESISFYNSITGKIRDNYITLEADAENADEAKRKFRDALTGFMQNLCIKTRVPHSFKGVTMYDEERRRYWNGPAEFGMNVRTYALDTLRPQLIEAAQAAGYSDECLHRALSYFEHAVWLYNHRREVMTSPHSAYLVAAVFLAIWKALSVVVGDPSSDKDYQKRYEQLGFDHKFFKERIESVRRYRNELDVAHYHLDPQAIERLEPHVSEAFDTAAEVIEAYRRQVVSTTQTADSATSGPPQAAS